jgi:hypothetical protein
MDLPQTPAHMGWCLRREMSRSFRRWGNGGGQPPKFGNIHRHTVNDVAAAPITTWWRHPDDAVVTIAVQGY